MAIPARYYDGSPLSIWKTIFEGKEATSSPLETLKSMAEKEVKTMAEKELETIVKKEEAILEAWMRKHM